MRDSRNSRKGKTRYLTPGELKAALNWLPIGCARRWPLPPVPECGAAKCSPFAGMDVDVKNRRLYLRETKNGALRILPIPESALTVLRSLPEGAAGDAVFAGVDPAFLSVYTKRVFKRLGILDASFHTLRHTAASWLVQQGVDLYAVGQILGHKTPRMTQRYAHLSPDYMAALWQAGRHHGRNAHSEFRRQMSKQRERRLGLPTWMLGLRSS